MAHLFRAIRYVRPAESATVTRGLVAEEGEAAVPVRGDLRDGSKPREEPAGAQHCVIFRKGQYCILRMDIKYYVKMSWFS